MVGRLLALVIGLFAGLVLSQAPEFAQQYRQRLGGAIDELGRVVGAFDASAAASGLTRDTAVARLALQPEPVARAQAEIMANAAERLARLERQRAAFAEAGPFWRVAALAREPDPALARTTYLDFEPGWPATAEGLTSGAIGFAIGWLAVFMGWRWTRRLGAALVGRRRLRPGATDLRRA